MKRDVAARNGQNIRPAPSEAKYIAMPSPKPPNAGPVKRSPRAAMSATTGSEAKAPANPAGNHPTSRPTLPAIAKVSSPPVQAVRRAVGQSRAPTARPTSAVNAEPTPNDSGIIRNSSRAEMP